MLKNQDAVPEPQISVSQVSVSQARVTPEELAQALAAIETRRQAEASRIAGTIPIEQAVSELHLDSTSDEIWTEVQAQRAKAAAAKQEPPSAAQAAPAQPLREFRQHIQSASEAKKVLAEARRSRPHPWWTGILAPVLIGWVLIQAGVVPHSWTRLPSNTSASAPILRPLASIADGTEVYADDASLAQLSKGTPTTQITVSQSDSGNQWRIVKLDGHVYLQGYIARTDSLQSLQGKAFNVYNDSNSGELDGTPTSNIRLRVDKASLQKSGGDDDYSEVTVPNFQPDPLTTLSAGR